MLAQAVPPFPRPTVARRSVGQGAYKTLLANDIPNRMEIMHPQRLANRYERPSKQRESGVLCPVASE